MDNFDWLYINTVTGFVENAVRWDGVSEYPLPEGYEMAQDPNAWIGWSAIKVDGVWQFTAPPVQPPDPEWLKSQARQERDRQLRSNYDVGVLMAMRAKRMATDPAGIAYADGKINELDAYAIALLGVPEQEGFPDTIVWPTVPTP